MNQDEKRELDTQLIVMGLKRLEDPGLVEQLGKMIPDHDILLGMINECDQEKRSEMYEAIKPHLRFKPWPLDRYVEMLARRASQIASRHEPVIVGDERFEQVAPDDSTGCVITFTCCKCTRQASFYGETPVSAAINGRNAGWVRDFVKQKEICPKCPAIREKGEIGNA